MEEKGLPDGWSLEKWNALLQITSGKNQKNVTSDIGKYPIYGSSGVIGRSTDFLCQANSVIIGRKGTINSPIYAKEPFWNVDTAFGLTPGDRLLPKFLFYFCLQFNFKSLDKSTTIPSLAKRDLLCIEMPLPPLTEQHRIVAKIEELFSELDKGVTELQKVKAQLQVYRQAVLKAAIGKIMEDSRKLKIKDICLSIGVGIVIKPSQYYTTQNVGIAAFRSANVREFYVNDMDWVYLTQEGHQKNSRSEVHTGDVLIVRSGYPGTACVVLEKYDGYNAIDILIASPNRDLVMSEYLCIFTNSPWGRKLVQEKKRGVAQAHLNVNGYSQMCIPVPPLDLQRKIVLEVDSSLSIYDKIDKTVDESLKKAEYLRQSILKQAFEGKLV